jgi:hypothetical protein
VNGNVVLNGEDAAMTNFIALSRSERGLRLLPSPSGQGGTSPSSPQDSSGFFVWQILFRFGFPAIYCALVRLVEKEDSPALGHCYLD